MFWAQAKRILTPCKCMDFLDFIEKTKQHLRGEKSTLNFLKDLWVNFISFDILKVF